MKITTAGLDLAKNVFQVHCVAEGGEVVLRKTLRRRQMIAFFRKLEPCLIGIVSHSLRAEPEYSNRRASSWISTYTD